MDQKLMGQMQDARLLAASEQVIFPVIEKMIAERLEQACGKFRAGDTSFVADIAYITSLKDIHQYLSSIQKRGLSTYEKLTKEQSDDRVRE